MSFDFLKKLQEKTEKYELKEEQDINKKDVLDGLEELGVPLPEDWLPDKLLVKLKKLKIDRATEPEATFEIEMSIEEPPPIIGRFLGFLEPKSTAFEVKTNQPPAEAGGSGRRKIWGFSVTLDFFGSEMTLKTGSENPKRFEMKDFEMNDDKFQDAWRQFGLDVPQALLDTIPGKKVAVKKLVVEEAEPKDYFEFEGSMEIRELFGGVLSQFMIAKAQNASFYYKQESPAS